MIGVALNQKMHVDDFSHMSLKKNTCIFSLPIDIYVVKPIIIRHAIIIIITYYYYYNMTRRERQIFS